MDNGIVSILSLTDIFDNLSDVQLDLIASICEPITCQLGDVLFRENDDTDELYVIGRGGVEILMNPGVVSEREKERQMDAIVLTELRQGQIVGEIALVDQGMRTATARVSQKKTRLLKVSRSRLMLLCDTYPELGYKIMRNVAADLAYKIRNTDLTVRQYQLMLSRYEPDALA